MKTKYVCFTLDLEEDHAGLLRNSYEGLSYLEDFINIIKKNKIEASIFIQTKLIELFPEKIEILKSENIDVHLHSYYHSLFPPKDKLKLEKEIKKCIIQYTNFFLKEPKGYRFPLGILQKEDYIILKKLNFKFDSSIFPTIRPGYFNNLYKPIKPYVVNGIIEIPFSVISRTLKIPVSLTFMKMLYPLHFLKSYNFSPLIIDFHLHDLFKLKSTEKLDFVHKIPYIRNSYKGLNILLKFNEKLKKIGYKSISINKLYKKIIDNKL